MEVLVNNESRNDKNPEKGNRLSDGKRPVDPVQEHGARPRTAHFLAFWVRITEAPSPATSAAWPDGSGIPEVFTDTWAATTGQAIDTEKQDVIQELLKEWQRAYDDVEATRTSVHTRANNLMLFAGILGGAGTLSLSALSGASVIVALTFAAVGLALAFFAVGTVFLAIRAQQIDVWTRTRLPPKAGHTKDGLERERAKDLYIAGRRNEAAAQLKVEYLARAQRFSLITLGLLVALSAVTWFAVVTKAEPPPGLAENPLPSLGSGEIRPSPGATSAPIAPTPAIPTQAAQPASSPDSGQTPPASPVPSPR